MADTKVNIQLSADGSQARREISLLEQQLQQLGNNVGIPQLSLGAGVNAISGNQSNQTTPLQRAQQRMQRLIYRESQLYTRELQTLNRGLPALSNLLQGQSQTLTQLQQTLQNLPQVLQQSLQNNTPTPALPPAPSVPRTNNAPNTNTNTPIDTNRSNSTGGGRQSQGYIDRQFAIISGRMSRMMGVLGILAFAQHAAQMDYDRQKMAYQTYGHLGTDSNFSAAARRATDWGKNMGYDYNEVLPAIQANQSSAGFAGLAAQRRDITAILGASRAYNIDANALAQSSGRMSAMGLFKLGDQQKFANMLAKAIKDGEMRGREREMVSAMETIGDKIASRAVTLNPQNFTGGMNLYGWLSSTTPALKGERGASLASRMIDTANSDDNGLDIAAGLGTKYVGLEGQMELWELKESNPAQYWKQVLQGYTGIYGEKYGEKTLIKKLKEQGFSKHEAEAMITGIKSGKDMGADFFSKAGQDEGKDEITKRLENYQQTTMAVLDKVEIEWNEFVAAVGEGINLLKAELVKALDVSKVLETLTEGVTGFLKTLGLIVSGEQSVGDKAQEVINDIDTSLDNLHKKIWGWSSEDGRSGGGHFTTPEDRERIRKRHQERWDNAVESSNSLSKSTKIYDFLSDRFSVFWNGKKAEAAELPESQLPGKPPIVKGAYYNAETGEMRGFETPDLNLKSVYGLKDAKPTYSLLSSKEEQQLNRRISESANRKLAENTEALTENTKKLSGGGSGKSADEERELLNQKAIQLKQEQEGWKKLFDAQYEKDKGVLNLIDLMMKNSSGTSSVSSVAGSSTSGGSTNLSPNDDSSHSKKENEMYRLAVEASDRVYEKTGKRIDPKLIYGQWAYESFDNGKPFNSELARKDNNFGGITYAKKPTKEGLLAYDSNLANDPDFMAKGVEVLKQKDGGTGYYQHLKSPRDFMLEYTDNFLIPRIEKGYITGDALKDPTAFATANHNSGYFTGNLKNYQAGVTTWSKNAPNIAIQSVQPKSGTYSIPQGTGISPAVLKDIADPLVGQHMVNDTVGCVEAAMKITKAFSKFSQANSGEVNVANLKKKAENAGLLQQYKHGDPLPAGTIMGWKDEKNSHVLVSDGKGGYYGNSSYPDGSDGYGTQSHIVHKDKPYYLGDPQWIINTGQGSDLVSTIDVSANTVEINANTASIANLQKMEDTNKSKNIKEQYNKVQNQIQQGAYGGAPHAMSFGHGLKNVPYDLYPANLHKGERVLTKLEAEELRDLEGIAIPNEFKIDEELDSLPEIKRKRLLQEKYKELTAYSGTNLNEKFNSDYLRKVMKETYGNAPLMAVGGEASGKPLELSDDPNSPNYFKKIVPQALTLNMAKRILESGAGNTIQNSQAAMKPSVQSVQPTTEKKTESVKPATEKKTESVQPTTSVTKTQVTVPNVPRQDTSKMRPGIFWDNGDPVENLEKTREILGTNPQSGKIEPRGGYNPHLKTRQGRTIPSSIKPPEQPTGQQNKTQPIIKGKSATSSSARVAKPINPYTAEFEERVRAELTEENFKKYFKNTESLENAKKQQEWLKTIHERHKNDYNQKPVRPAAQPSVQPVQKQPEDNKSTSLTDDELSQIPGELENKIAGESKGENQPLPKGISPDSPVLQAALNPTGTFPKQPQQKGETKDKKKPSFLQSLLQSAMRPEVIKKLPGMDKLSKDVPIDKIFALAQNPMVQQAGKEIENFFGGIFGTRKKKNKKGEKQAEEQKISDVKKSEDKKPKDIEEILDDPQSEAERVANEKPKDESVDATKQNKATEETLEKTIKDKAGKGTKQDKKKPKKTDAEKTQDIGKMLGTGGAILGFLGKVFKNDTLSDAGTLMGKGSAIAGKIGEMQGGGLDPNFTKGHDTRPGIGDVLGGIFGKPKTTNERIFGTGVVGNVAKSNPLEGLTKSTAGNEVLDSGSDSESSGDNGAISINLNLHFDGKVDGIPENKIGEFGMSIGNQIKTPLMEVLKTSFSSHKQRNP